MRGQLRTARPAQYNEYERQQNAKRSRKNCASNIARNDVDDLKKAVRR